MEKCPKVGIVGGKVYYLNKHKIAFCGTRFNFYTGQISLGRFPNKIGPTDWVSGCNLLVRKTVLDKIGLFDDRFYFYFEDLDLCLRAKKAGFQVFYHPRAVLYHQEGKTIDREFLLQKSDFFYQGKTRLLFKHETIIQLISTLLFQFLLSLPFHLIILKQQDYLAATKALMQILKENFSHNLKLEKRLA